MPDAQNQTYTFLFTDIEGSTRLWEQHPEAMHVALATHDAILKRHIELNRGHVFKTVGDAFCAAFEHASDAIKAAASAQLELAQTDMSAVGKLRIRAALYTGDARQRDNDYFGTALNRVARLLAAGHGGQTLLSAATAELVRGRLPDEVGILDLGPHQLRDLENWENIFQVTHPMLDREFPELRSLAAWPNNLPRDLTSFVGREREVEEIKGLLGTSALLTLIGAGGCGKTRLALQVAHDVSHEYEGGVWFVELAPLTDPTLLPRTIAAALNVPEEQASPVLESLKKRLRTQATLVILDNCEHVVGACAQIADQLLRAAPKLRILATSREALGVPGETSWKVPSLSLPESSQPSADDLIDQSEAARLFVERAQNVHPGFAATDANAPSIASVCRRLDGIPLAIELAAARVKALPVEQIAARLDDRFRLLTGGSRTALPRQQTLRATIDWSYNLLSEGERLLFCRLAVFTGGWTLDAAEAVCSGEGIEEWETLDLISQLVDKSLVAFEQQLGEARYRQLETVRQYARERLFDQFDATALRRKHVQFCLDFAAGAEAQLSGAEQVHWLNRLESEHDNCRAALEWSESDPEGAESCLRLAKSLARFWEIRGNYAEGSEWLNKALAIGPADLDDLRMRALNQLGNIRREQANYHEARTAFESALVLARKLGFRKGIAILLNNLGITHLNLGDTDASSENYEESIVICRAEGYRSDLARALDNLATLCAHSEDYARARALHTEALDIFRSLNDIRSIAISLYSLGDLERQECNLDAAGDLLRESLARSRDLAFKTGIASSIEGLALVDSLLGRHERAVKLLGAASALRERIGSPLPPQSLSEHDSTQRLLKETLGDEEFARLYNEGLATPLDRAIEIALTTSR